MLSPSGFWYVLCLSALLSFFNQSSLYAEGPTIPVPEDSARNWSTAYTHAYSRLDDLWTEEHYEKLRQYHFIFIPGFMSNAIIDVSNSKIDFMSLIAQYFDKQMAWLEDNEIENERLMIESEDEKRKNAKLLIQALNNSPKKVIIVAHSKGGLDTLSAYMRQMTLFKDKVAGVITIQSPFNGSPIADMMLEQLALDLLVSQLLRSLGGTRKSMESLTQQYRGLYNGAHNPYFADLLTQIPFLNYASYQPNHSWQIDTIMEVSRNIMLKKNLPSDGMVPWSSAIMPTAPFVVESDVDHLATVMPIPFQHKIDRVRFLKTLIYQLMPSLK